MSRRINVPVHVPDKYDLAIAILRDAIAREHSWEVGLAWKDGPVWDQPGAHPAACLFRDAGSKEQIHEVGCLTQVRCGESCAATPELTARIRADERLPLYPEQIRERHFDVFAELQRLIDEMGLR